MPVVRQGAGAQIGKTPRSSIWPELSRKVGGVVGAALGPVNPSVASHRQQRPPFGKPTFGRPQHGKPPLEKASLEKAPPRRRSRLRVSDWRVRTKLGVVLIIPSLAFLIVGGVEIRGFVNESTVLDDFAQQVEFAQQVTAVVHEVQAERDRTIGELAAFEASGRRGGPGLLSSAVRDQRAVVD